MTLVRADAWMCAVPMPYPLRLGHNLVRTRDYAVLRLTFDDGHSSSAIGYVRGVPLLALLEPVLAQLGPDDDAVVPSEVFDRTRSRFPNAWANVLRAASLVDIALWHAWTEREGGPLAVAPRPTSLMMVAGYFVGERGLGAVLDEVRRFLDDGCAIVKVMVPGRSRREDVDLVAQIADAVDGRAAIAADLHGSSISVEDALAFATSLADAGGVFLEDPFPGFPIDDLRQLATRSPVPIALGEDLAEPGLLPELATVAGILRLDATASGGYTFAMHGLEVAAAAGIDVIPHVWPATHRRLTGVSECISAIELIPPYVGADPIDQLMDPSGEPDWRRIDETASAYITRSFTQEGNHDG